VLADPANLQVGSLRIEDSPYDSQFKKNPCRNSQIGLYNPLKETYGRRYANYMQRLRAGIYLQCCRSDVLSRTWLLDPKALQALPHGKEKRSGGIRLPFGSFTGNTCDLFGLRTANNRSIRTPWRSSGVLPGLLHSTQRQRRRGQRTRPVESNSPVRTHDQLCVRTEFLRTGTARLSGASLLALHSPGTPSPLDVCPFQAASKPAHLNSRNP
jgi:hypothetical protein